MESCARVCKLRKLAAILGWSTVSEPHGALPGALDRELQVLPIRRDGVEPIRISLPVERLGRSGERSESGHGLLKPPHHTLVFLPQGRGEAASEFSEEFAGVRQI